MKEKNLKIARYAIKVLLIEIKSIWEVHERLYLAACNSNVKFVNLTLLSKHIREVHENHLNAKSATADIRVLK